MRRAPHLWVVLLCIVGMTSPGTAFASSSWTELERAPPETQTLLLRELADTASDADKRKHAPLLLKLVSSSQPDTRRFALRMLYDVDDVAVLRRHRRALQSALEDPGEAGAYGAILWARTQPPAGDAVYLLLQRGSRAFMQRDDWVRAGVVEALSTLDTDKAHPLFDVILRDQKLAGLFHMFIAQALERQKDTAKPLLPALKVAASFEGRFARDVRRTIAVLEPPSVDDARATCLQAPKLTYRNREACTKLVSDGPVSDDSRAFLWVRVVEDKHLQVDLYKAVHRHATPAWRTRVVDHLHHRFTSPQEQWRSSAAQALVVLGDVGVQRVLDEVDAADPRQRQRALEALVDVPLAETQWKTICWRMMKDDDVRVRQAAARAMKRPGTALAHVVRALQLESHDDVRVALWGTLQGSRHEVALIVQHLQKWQAKQQKAPPSSSTSSPYARRRRRSHRRRHTSSEVGVVAQRAVALAPQLQRWAPVVDALVVVHSGFADALLQMGPVGQQRLRAGLLDVNVDHRLAVLRLLSRQKALDASWAHDLGAASHDAASDVREQAFACMRLLPDDVDVNVHLRRGLRDTDRDAQGEAIASLLQRTTTSEALQLGLAWSRKSISYDAKRALAAVVDNATAVDLRPFVDDFDDVVRHRPSRSWLQALARVAPKRALPHVESILSRSADADVLKAAASLVRTHRWSTSKVRSGLVKQLKHRREHVRHAAAKALVVVGNTDERRRAAPIAAKTPSPFLQLELP